MIIGGLKRTGRRTRAKVPTIGELRTPVSLVTRTRTPDATTGFDLAVDPYADVFARIERGRGQYQDGNAVVDILHTIVIRSDTAYEVAARDWVVFGGRFFRIVEVEPLAENADYLIMSVADDGQVAKYKFDNVDTPENPNDPDTPVPEPAAADPNNPFFTFGVDE